MNLNKIVKKWFELQTQINGYNQLKTPYSYERIKHKFKVVINKGNATLKENSIQVYMTGFDIDVISYNLGGNDSIVNVSLNDLQRVFVNFGGKLVTKREFIKYQKKVPKRFVLRHWRELKVNSLSEFLREY